MIGASIGIMMELGVGIVIIFEILLRKSIDGGSAVLSGFNSGVPPESKRRFVPALSGFNSNLGWQSFK
jgi:Na+-transporting methylmalonyl-CoA/oxaloacetate decarboxylase gamma subunit